MAKSGVEQYTVRNPDFIPEGQEHLWPAKGGQYHDFIPEGKTALTMHEPAPVARETLETILVDEEAEADEKPIKGKK